MAIGSESIPAIGCGKCCSVTSSVWVPGQWPLAMSVLSVRSPSMCLRKVSVMYIF